MFFDSDSPEPFPLDALPPVLRDAVSTVAVSLGQHPDMAAAFGITACSLAVSNLVAVEIQSGHVEPTVTWTMLLCPKGGAKTPTQKAMLQPVRGWHERHLAEVKPSIDAERAEYDQMASEIKADKTALAKKKPGDRDKDRPALIDREVAFMALTKPEMPKLISGNFTQQGLEKDLKSAKRPMLLFDDEGDEIVASIGGRHTDGETSAAAVLKLWAGGHTDESRAGREGVGLDDKALAVVCLSIQPDVLATGKNISRLTSQGFLDRFGVHIHKLRPIPANPPKRDASALAHYAGLICGLMDLPPYAAKSGEPEGLTLSPAARAFRTDFIDGEMNLRVAEGGDLEMMTGEVAKIRASIERLAGVFHMVKFPTGAAYRVPISGETFSEAIEVGRYWLSHCLHSREGWSKTPAERAAQRCLRWIQREAKRGHLEDGTFGKQSIWQSLKASRGTITDTKELDEALGVLVRHNFIRAESGKPVRYAVNPSWNILGAHAADERPSQMRIARDVPLIPLKGEGEPLRGGVLGEIGEHSLRSHTEDDRPEEGFFDAECLF